MFLAESFLSLFIQLEKNVEMVSSVTKYYVTGCTYFVNQSDDGILIVEKYR